jgi:hypothetical protein
MLPNGYGLGFVAEFVFSIEALEMCSDGTDSNTKIGGDLLVGQAADR